MERIVYCHCAFARVIPLQTKSAVLAHLASGDAPFEAVPDLCEMAARRDQRLQKFAASAPLIVVACYERAVRGLFHAAGASLPADGITVVNMRTETGEALAARIDELTAGSAGPASSGA